jgi:ISXO2-like transposase domain
LALFQIDETLVGGKGSPNKELILVAVEPSGRARLAHAPNNDAGTLELFADAQIAPDTGVTSDGHAGYNATSLGARPHDGVVQTKAERRQHDVVRAAHFVTSLLKRWLLGTHAGAVSAKHLRAYLDDFAFRYNRRHTKGVVRIAARVIEAALEHAAMPMKMLVKETRRCRQFPIPELSG